MTEEEWLSSTNLYEMERHILASASERKRRLFVCACCRQVLPLLNDPRSLVVVETAERFADGQASEAEVRAAYIPIHPGRGAVAAVWASEMLANIATPGARPLQNRGDVTEHAARALRDAAGEWNWDGAHRRQAALLKDLFGNPFRPVVIEPGWLTWDRGTVAKMARAIYEEYRFHDLPILGDALEEAGCHDPRILDHCRRPGEHARGCWLIDCLLGKE
jgi:hypothetical protein